MTTMKVPRRDVWRFLGVWPLRPAKRTVWFSVLAILLPIVVTGLVVAVSAALGLVELDLIGFSGLAAQLEAAGVDPQTVPLSSNAGHVPQGRSAGSSQPRQPTSSPNARMALGSTAATGTMSSCESTTSPSGTVCGCRARGSQCWGSSSRCLPRSSSAWRRRSFRWLGA